MPENTEVETYSDDEYRFDLTNDFKIIFSGIVYQIKGKSVISKKTGKYIDSYDQYSDTINPQ